MHTLLAPSQVEKLLEEVAAAEANAASASGAAADGAAASHSALSESELVSQCRLLERVAAEVSRLAFLANKGKVRHGTARSPKAARTQLASSYCVLTYSLLVMLC